MDDKNTENRRDRKDLMKKIIIAVLIVLLIFPNIISVFMLVRQAKLEDRINRLSDEIARMRLGTYGDIGRLSDEGRVAVIKAFPELMDSEPGERDTAIAELPAEAGEDEERPAAAGDAAGDKEETAFSTEDVVWAFSARGEIEEPAHKVYLTFDDGPSEYTDDILDILSRYGVKATFFVVGKESDADIELYRRIVEEGHTLGMHSYSHVYSRIYASEESFTADLDKISGLLEEATGVKPEFYRFPGGSSNAVSNLDMHRFIKILDDRGISYFDWNVASGDATRELLSSQTILANSTRGITERGTSVILMHDSVARPTTVQALPQIIETILNMEDTAILPITSDTEQVRHVE
ncbi:MAG: polysaccharide deacetylase [Lachnospiraceae bacterium]|nr:polysaccharide deacetylase [Lachnospiraceae bacterium]